MSSTKMTCTIKVTIAALLLIHCAYAEVIPNKIRRSIDLPAAHALISDAKLPRDVTPDSYHLKLIPNPAEGSFSGEVRLNISWQSESGKVVLHAHPDLQVVHETVKIRRLQAEHGTRSTTAKPSSTPVTVLSTERHPKRPVYIINLNEPLQRGAHCELQLEFSGIISDSGEGLFRTSYDDVETGEKKWLVATHFRPNLARQVFPCFDEPGYKVPFEISIARQRNMSALSNMPIKETVDKEDDPDMVWDHFMKTPPISTFTLGFVVSELTYISANVTDTESEDTSPEIRVWGRADFLQHAQEAADKIRTALNVLQDYWQVAYPLPKLDCVAIPGLQSVRPADNWGLILFKENTLMSRGYYQISQELVYQWLGALATPYWWSDAHVNKALVGFLSASTALQIDNGSELEGKWPMTILYSIYYEFSKRYPHSRITGMKQETTCSKTELVFRMLNYTLGEKTFRAGLQRFMLDRQYTTFFGDDVWKSLTEQARHDDVLCDKVSVNEIAASWITKDRIPVVTVTRNYDAKTAKVKQAVYLRERPHDVPEQDKLLWWIPLVIVTQDKMNFSNSKPVKWMKKAREVTLDKMPASDQFIIVNPEEIGPFPVNYDERNWNLLARFLLDPLSRHSIPVYTRAKLLHDAWNLAYAGDLCFTAAFNMTLFMRDEREHLVWDPVFTMIDHIGRHIDSSEVHKKFEIYVRILLTPLYEELGPEQQEDEEGWKTNLRRMSKNFLCKAGYKPCIEEAQAAYKQWMDSEDPDESNPVPNQYICPVFKWGTMEEWEFGLNRIIEFPSTRKPSERTYLLKTLAGCPIQSNKIERLLNITILEQNGNFTDNDIFLIFSMLTGGSRGYTTLFTFLSKNWDTIKIRFEDKTNLWDNLISSATSVFTTQAGLDLVTGLYKQRRGEFGSAEHIIEKSIRNIKEETKWSDDNLPVIEKWLDNYLNNNNNAAAKFIG